MNKIICKPCFAFDALAAIVLHKADCNGFRNDIPYVKEQSDTYFNELKIPGSDSYFHLLADNYSFDNIEKMDLKTFTEIYTNCIKCSEFETEFIKGLKILNDMNFTFLWDKYCLPFLHRQCDEYNSLIKLENETVSGVLSDIQKVKSNEKIDDINIYMTYFTKPVHMSLSSHGYITNHSENEEINIKRILNMFAHELTHGFANKQIREIYEKTREEDEFLKKTKSIMYKWGQTGDEEEFVCALSDYISYKNGLIAKEDVYNQNYINTPVRFIVLNELLKLGEIPNDVNAWIYGLFENGTIKAGEIMDKINILSPGYVDNFINIHCKD